MITAKFTYVTYHSSLIHNVTDIGELTMKDLPLIDAPNTKGKKFKEFFHLVEGVSPEDADRVRVAMSSNPPGGLFW